MSVENNPHPEYCSVGSSSKRRKLSNDSNDPKLAMTGGSSEALPKVDSLAAEDSESASTSTSADKTRPEKVLPNTTEKPNVSSSGPVPEKATGFGETKVLPESNQPVFGAASAFGSASIFEKMKNKVNVFDGLAAGETPNDKETGHSIGKQALTLAVSESLNHGSSVPETSSGSNFGGFGSTFGANSVFSNALQRASQKKSFLDEPGEELKPSETVSPQASQQFKQVDLKETIVTTGEENETSIFNANTKLFELDFSKVSEGWKERGVGPLHLNKAVSGKAQARLVMRSKGLLRVILNYAINPSTVFIKGLEASLTPGKFLRMNSVVAEKPVQYMLKFRSEELRDELFDKVEQLKEELKAKAETTDAKARGAESLEEAEASEEVEKAKEVETSKEVEKSKEAEKSNEAEKSKEAEKSNEAGGSKTKAPSEETASLKPQEKGFRFNDRDT